MVRFVVMASGQAKRMGQDKLALPWGDTTVLGHVLEAILKSTQEGAGISVEVRVVARKPRSHYWDKDSGNIKWVWINEPEPRPLSATIRLGLADLPHETQGICFVPGDQVGLEPRKLAELTACFIENQPDFLIPVEESGIKGSPLFFHRRYVEELCSLKEEQGGSVLLKRYPERGRTYLVPAGFLEDVDTPEDYRKFDFEARMFDNM